MKNIIISIFFHFVLLIGFTANAQNGFLDNGATYSPDGKKIAFHSNRTGHTEIWIMNADGSNLKPVTQSKTNDRWPQFSSDGRKMVFMSMQDENWEIYSINTDGTDRTRLTNNTVTDLGASFSPDGKKVAYTSLREDGSGVADLYIMEIESKISEKVSDEAYWPTWSADGKKIAYTHGIKNGNADIWVYDIRSRNAKGLTAASGANFGAKFSKSGRKIIFFSNRDGEFKIFTMNQDGTDQTNLNIRTSGDGNPNFSPDERYILFSYNPNDDADLFLLEMESGKITNITP